MSHEPAYFSKIRFLTTLTHSFCSAAWVENCRNARGCFTTGGRSVQSGTMDYSCFGGGTCIGLEDIARKGEGARNSPPPPQWLSTELTMMPAAVPSPRRASSGTVGAPSCGAAPGDRQVARSRCLAHPHDDSRSSGSLVRECR